MTHFIRENLLFLNEVERSLARARIPSARAEAETLVRHFGRMSRIDFFTGRKAVKPAARKAVSKALRARVGGRPLGYLTGEADFLGRTFWVTPDTLIPRPETEMIVAEAARHLRRAAHSRPEVLEIGTGTGCIAVCLTSEVPGCKMTALDLSHKALRVARRNVRRHGLAGRIDLLQSDLFSRFEGTGRAWDMIISNPPYIPEADLPGLPREVRSEPSVALNGGPGGLRVLEAILGTAPRYLKKGGRILLEIHADHAKPLSKILRGDSRYETFRFLMDFSGHDRVLDARRT